MKTLLLLLTVLLGEAVATTFKDCGSTEKDVTVNIPGCEDKCVFHPGDTISGTISFTPRHNITTLSASARISVGIFSLPFNGFDADACVYLTEGQSCPIKAGHTVHWQYEGQIPHNAPPCNVGVRFHLEDNEGHKAVCLKKNVRVTVKEGLPEVDRTLL